MGVWRKRNLESFSNPKYDLSERGIFLGYWRAVVHTFVCGPFSSRFKARAYSRSLDLTLSPSVYLQANGWGRGKHATAYGVMGVRGFSSHSSYNTQAPAPSWVPRSTKHPLLPWASCLSLDAWMFLTVLSPSPGLTSFSPSNKVRWPHYSRFFREHCSPKTQLPAAPVNQRETCLTTEFVLSEFCKVNYDDCNT